MADKVVIVGIEYDTSEAVASLGKLTDAIVENEQQQESLKKAYKEGSITQEQYSQAVAENTAEMNKAKAERKNTITQLQAEKGSVNELKSEIKRLVTDRDKLNQTTGAGKKEAEAYNKKIVEMQTALKGATGETGKAKGAFAAFGQSLSDIPGPIGGVISGIGGMTKAALTFIATPIGAVIAAIGLALKALMSYFKGSEEGQNRLNKITNVAIAIWESFMDIVEKVGEIISDAISKPKETIIKLGELIKENLINRFTAFGVIGKAIVKILKGDFKEGFKQLAEGGVQAVTGVTNSFEKLGNAIAKTKEYLKGVGEETAKKIKLANQLSDIQAKADKLERTLIVDKAKIENEVSELRLKAAQKDQYNEEQRLAFLKDASAMIDQLATKEEGLGALRLKEAQLRLTIEDATKEALTEVAQKEADLINIRAESLDKRRKIEGQISMLTLKQGDEAIATSEKVVEVDSKGQDDILKRRGEAIAELADLKAQEIIDAEKNVDKKYKLEKSELEREKGLALSDARLLAEEKEVINQEFKMREIELQIAHEEQLKAIRAEALADAQASMQAIIDAAGNMGDERVNIALDAFSKLSTINWDEVKDAKGAFMAIGQSAQGLTSLITSGNQSQLDDLKLKYDQQILAAGTNTKQKELLEKQYNQKLVKLKKQQFKEDKIKAIVDAGIATALGIANSLKSGGIIGLALAAIVGIAGGVQIAKIARQKEPNFTSDKVFAKGGAVIGGKSHAQGGTEFRGSDGLPGSLAEKGEGLYIMKKDATAEIAALGMINESFGGRAWSNNKPSRYLADGGAVDTSSQIDTNGISRAITEGMQNVTIITQVSDIKLGMQNYDNVVKPSII